MFSHLIEYFEYDNVDYDNIYVNNLLKILKFSECEDIWSNFQKATKYCEKINKLKGIQTD